MTDSMIPYSFIPGTKAKASEVNANFSALAQIISQNAAFATDKIDKTIEQFNQFLNEKADKTDLITEHNITESETDLNNYKQKGTYIFSSAYIPVNAPKSDAGMLIVFGEENSELKQIWLTNGYNPAIFTREYINSNWSQWYSTAGERGFSNQIGYYQLPNGLIIQWGINCPSAITYPIAYNIRCGVVFSKYGWAANYERSDTGINSQSLTGFTVGSCGVFYNMNFIVIGE